MVVEENSSADNFRFSSSIADDVWHLKAGSKSYEWWYFDALSDDGREAVVIIFLDNFIFSPRYNRSAQTADFQSPDAALRSENENPHSPLPAIAFFYYRDGKPVYRGINEFSPEDFSASKEKPFCQIGESFFEFKNAPYGSGYFLSVKANLIKNCRLEAQFEWLSIESDFKSSEKDTTHQSHHWNLVVPRADVSGKINVFNQRSKQIDTLSFRGTGYHDHNYDHRWLPETVQDWQWGRAHFSDATAVFYRYNECSEAEPITRLFIVRENSLQELPAVFEEQQFKRDIFGVKFPQRMTFRAKDNVRLRVKQIKTIDSSFFYLRFLSEITLTLRDGKPRKSIGITEFLKPKTLKYRWLDFLVNMRIGRGGKGAKML